jgi:tetrapyrrole methylase family protein/MazG family protein
VQTHATIKLNAVEEAYEVAEAIDGGDVSLLKEELGDLLLQVVFHAQMEEEIGGFDFEAVCDGICKKLIVRHPHVFGDIIADTPDEVLKNWDDIKSKNKGEQTYTERLQSVPKLLPALMRGEKVAKRAAHANSGFGYKNADAILAELEGEIEELRVALGYKSDTEIEGELGDVLLCCCNLGNFLGKDCENLLTKATNRFIMRFGTVENAAQNEGQSLAELTAEQLDKLWHKAKSQGVQT